MPSELPVFPSLRILSMEEQLTVLEQNVLLFLPFSIRGDKTNHIRENVHRINI